MSFQFINKIDKYSTIIIETNKIINTPEFSFLTNDYFNTDIDITLENLSIEELYLKINESMNESFIITGIEGFSEIKDWIVNFIKRISEWIKKIVKHVVEFFKAIYRYIKKLFGFSDTKNLDVSTEEKSESIYSNLPSDNKHKLDDIAQKIKQEIDNFKSCELITKNDLKSIETFFNSCLNNMPIYINQLYNKNNNFTNEFYNKSIYKQMIDDNVINTSNLPDWFRDQISNNNYIDKIIFPKIQFKDFIDSYNINSSIIFTEKYTGSNVLNKYYNFGQIIEKEIVNITDSYESMIDNIDKTAANVFNKIQNFNLFNNQIDILKKQMMYVSRMFCVLIQINNKNLILSIKELFKIFESNLSNEITNIVKIISNKTKSNIQSAEYIRNLKPFTHCENLPVYTRNQLSNSQVQNQCPYLAQIVNNTGTTFVFILVSDNIVNLPSNVQKFILYHEYGHYVHHHNFDKIIIMDRTNAQKPDYQNNTNKERMIQYKDANRPLKNELQADIYAVNKTSIETALEFLQGIINYFHLQKPKLNDKFTTKPKYDTNYGFLSYTTTERRQQDIFSRYEYFERWLKNPDNQPRLNGD